MIRLQQCRHRALGRLASRALIVRFGVVSRTRDVRSCDNVADRTRARAGCRVACERVNAEVPEPDAVDGEPPPQTTRMRWAIVGILVALAIVGPFLIWGDVVDAWVEAWTDDRRPTAITVLAFGALLAADVLLPVPSSVVAVAAGMRLGLLGAILTLSTGATVGCAIGWGVGRGLGRPGLRRFVGPRALARFDDLVARHGVGALVVSRAVPVLAEASVIAAGAGRFGFLRTMAWTAGANVVVALVYAGAGELAVATETPAIALLVALGVPGVAILVSSAASRRRRRAC